MADATSYIEARIYLDGRLVPGKELIARRVILPLLRFCGCPAGTVVPEVRPVIIATGVSLIAAERARHERVEGFDAAHDSDHDRGELALAAAAYAINSTVELNAIRKARLNSYRAALWPRPWRRWWKPKAPIRDLIRSGALIAAEIDRRLAEGEKIDFPTYRVC